MVATFEVISIYGGHSYSLDYSLITDVSLSGYPRRVKVMTSRRLVHSTRYCYARKPNIVTARIITFLFSAHNSHTMIVVFEYTLGRHRLRKPKITT
jgi:hypothetical protein